MHIPRPQLYVRPYSLLYVLLSVSMAYAMTMQILRPQLYVCASILTSTGIAIGQYAKTVQIPWPQLYERPRKSPYSSNHSGANHIILQIVLVQYSLRGKELKQCCPRSRSYHLCVLFCINPYINRLGIRLRGVIFLGIFWLPRVSYPRGAFFWS